MTLGLAVALIFGMFAVPAIARDDRTPERYAMVEAIQDMALSIRGVALHPGFEARVLAALRSVPRHEFVPRESSHLAYSNRPLPNGFGQTISQPFIVAMMTDLLQVKPSDRVLEIGTGSGYHAAVLSLLAREVYSIEIVPELGERATLALTRLGHANVTTRIGDGYLGWEEHSPYDAIIVTAAPDHVPPALVAQLRPGGRLVIPVGVILQISCCCRKQTTEPRPAGGSSPSGSPRSRVERNRTDGLKPCGFAFIETFGVCMLIAISHQPNRLSAGPPATDYPGGRLTRRPGAMSCRT